MPFHAAAMVKVQRGCELCEGVAAVYCRADEAYICWTCDAKVHSANFLVARHTRSILCKTCSGPTAWGASGAEPTPSTYLCANCLEKDCMSVGALDSQGVSSRSCISAGGSGAGCDCGSASRNSKIIYGKVADKESNLGSTSKSRFRVISICLDNSCGDLSLQAIAPKEFLFLKKRKAGFNSPRTELQSSLTAMDRLEYLSGATSIKRQCTVDAPTSNNQRDTPSNQGQFLDIGHWRTYVPASHLNVRASNSAVLSRFKQRRVDGSRQGRPPLHTRRQRAALQPTARLMRMMAKWHWDLHLSSPGTVPLAIRLLRKVSRALSPAKLPRPAIRAILAACLRLAARLDEAEISVPSAHEFSSCAGISATSLAMTEIQLPGLLE